MTAFVSGLQREPRLLGDDWVDFQDGLIGAATLNDRGAIITALLDLDPAILRRQPPPPSQAIEFAFTYAKTHLIPLLTRIWPVPDDLPHAAGMGDLSRVKHWFDKSGAACAGRSRQSLSLQQRTRAEETTSSGASPAAQQVLDTALAWSVINRHFDVADFLLEHGANINTNWNSHEPASILHHLVFLPNPYESMQLPHRPRHRHDHQGLSLEQHCKGLGTLCREGPEDGSVAGGCGTAAELRR